MRNRHYPPPPRAPEETLFWEEEHTGDLKFRVCGANCLEKFRNLMFAEIGRNLARVDQLDEQLQRPPSSFVFYITFQATHLS
jgi:hypothetical protein